MTGFQLASLFHYRGPFKVELFTGQEATVLGWRIVNVPSTTQGVKGWHSPAARLLIDGEVTHGWAPETIVKLV